MSANPATAPAANPSRLEIVKYGVNLGAEVRGIDLNDTVSEEDKVILRKALDDYGVLFLDQPDLKPQRFADFVQIFGQIVRLNPLIPIDDANAGASVIGAVPAQDRAAGLWHIDNSYTDTPPKFTSLYGVDVPDWGGDTLWSNAVLAFEQLDPLLAAYVESLTGIFGVQAGHRQVVKDADAAGKISQREDRLFPPVEAPLVKYYPELGKKALYANEALTVRIKDVNRTTSNAILSILFDTIKNPELQIRYRWKKGALVIWDNRQTHHRGTADVGSQPRRLLRFTID